MSRLKIVAGIAISVAVFAYLVLSVDVGELMAQLARTEWRWVVVSLAASLLGLYARAVRWRYLFPPRSDPPALVPAMMIGYMANNILPLRAGEIVRVWVVARRWGHGFWTALATLVVERVLDSLSIVLILGVLVLLIPVPATFRWAAAVLLAIDIAGLVVLTVLAVAPGRGRRALEWLSLRWPALERRAARIYDTFVRGLDGVRTPAHIAPLFIWTVIVWVLPAISAWTMLMAAGLHLSWIAAWTVLAFVGLGISIPSAPGYVGVFHAAAALAVGLFGVSQASALGFAILFHASQYVAVTLIGWIYLLREGMRLGDATRERPPAEEAITP